MYIYPQVLYMHMLLCTLIGVYNLPLFCVQVNFIGEEAIDQGGPKREFWRLLAIDIMTKLCIGSDHRLTLEHNVAGLEVSAKLSNSTVTHSN